MIDINNFDAIRIGLASSKQIRDWSSGEAPKPETINYRTLKPEKDGLFCERILSDEGLGVLLRCTSASATRASSASARRRGDAPEGAARAMGHIDPPRPVSHIWFFMRPSRIGYLLDIAPKELEKVLYFAASIVTQVEVSRSAPLDLNDLEDKVRGEYERINVDRDEALAALEDRLAPARLLHEGQGAQLRRGRRVLGPRPDGLGRGAGPAHRRGGAASASGIFAEADGHDRGLEEDPRARPLDGGPGRPAARPAGYRGGRQRRGRSSRRSRRWPSRPTRRPAPRRARSRST